MKKQFHILILSLGLLLIPALIFAQLFVDPEGNVGLGLEDSPDARMKILNGTTKNEGIGLLIENNSELDEIIGSKITISELGFGQKTGMLIDVANGGNASQSTLGLDLEVKSNGTGEVFGMRVSNSGTATGTKYGISNEVSSTNDGILNNPLFGQFNTTYVQGIRPTYGLYNLVSVTNNSEDQFGIYNLVEGGGSGLKYGIYSVVNSGEGYAGYFLGDVQINGNLTYTSDENLKENIANVDNALAIIRKLQPKSYNFKKANQFGPSSTQRQYGFLAQEVEYVLPDIVKEVTQPAVKQITDGAANSIIDAESEVDLKAIDYNAIIAILTQGIKEQQLLIDALTKRIEELEK